MSEVQIKTEGSSIRVTTTCPSHLVSESMQALRTPDVMFKYNHPSSWVGPICDGCKARKEKR